MRVPSRLPSSTTTSSASPTTPNTCSTISAIAVSMLASSLQAGMKTDSETPGFIDGRATGVAKDGAS